MKFIDLFSGIGGFRQGFEKLGFKCVFSCEINSPCRQVYADNFGEVPFEDISKINPVELEDFEILVAGFPCQPFSICGKKLGFEDTRGTLFFDICKIIKIKQPKVIVLENVKHLIHHDKGNTLKVIIASLEDLGYSVNYKMLNAKDFGIPQHRERIFIIATKGKPFNFSRLKTKATPKLREFLDKTGDFEIVDKSEYTLIESPRKQDSGLLFVGYRNKGTWKTGVRPNTEHLSRVHRQPNRIYSVDGVHPTIPSQETSGRFFIYIPEQDMVRKLTLKECYRLMGFPEDFKSYPSAGESYKQIGNSVCVPVVEAIAKEILSQNLLSNEPNEPQRKTEEYIQLVLFNTYSQMSQMNHKEKLKNIYSLSVSIADIQEIPQQYLEYILLIGEEAYKQKGVYTVLVTLLTHKSLFPEQDIRKHQSSMPGGFSGRTIDTLYITPTLKELRLPSMAESGWLTRSLEQPFPYNLDYRGNISDKEVKKAFLNIIDYVESRPEQVDNVLRLILNKVIQVQAKNIVKVAKLVNPDTLNILSIVSCLEEHFSTKYKVRGGSKLPVLAIYAMYKSLLDEVKRYENCILAPLGSHTASDLTSRSSGDIEVFDEHGQICEAIEVKLDREIDLTIVLVAYEKIRRFNPKRYYILSGKDIKVSELQGINNIISEVREEHGCQIIINGVIPTIQYYLRLISLENFVTNYSNLVSLDTELQPIHKIKWNELIEKLSVG